MIREVTVCSRSELKNGGEVDPFNEVKEVNPDLNQISLLKIVVGIKGETFDCFECTFKTNKLRYLNHHIESKHKDVKRFRCAECHLKAYYKHSVKYHIENSHKDSEVKILTIGCEKCDKMIPHRLCSLPTIDEGKTKNVTDLNNRHLKSGTKKEGVRNGRYKCSLCDHRCNQKPSAKMHLQSQHRGEVGEIIGHGCEKCETKIHHRICRFIKQKDTNGEDKSKFACNVCKV